MQLGGRPAGTPRVAAILSESPRWPEGARLRYRPASLSLRASLAILQSEFSGRENSQPDPVRGKLSLFSEYFAIGMWTPGEAECRERPGLYTLFDPSRDKVWRLS